MAECAPELVSRGLSTRAVHAGEKADATPDATLAPDGEPTPPPGRRPAAVPVVHTAPWVFADSAALEEAFGALPGDRRGLYSRYENPTVRSLERKVAALEEADDAVAFASGMAAISTTLTALLAPGDRLLAAADLYGGTSGWLQRLAGRRPDVAVERVPLAALAARLESDAGGNAREGNTGDLAAVYLETPSNPLLACCDLAAVAAACRRLGERGGRTPRLIVDATMASPAVQRPLRCGAEGRGADLVIHSATKFLAGHSDVTAGVVAGAADLVELVRREAIAAGPCLDPHAAFLVSRGVKTLALRLARQSDNAARLARLLAGHPAVARVHYPGLGSLGLAAPAGAFDPVAAGQMTCGGPMLAFELAGGLPAARALVDALEVFALIPSLGGVESGVVLPALTSHRDLSAEERRERGIAAGLVRVSCGIEDGDDLEADLRRGLEGLAASGAAGGGA